MSAFSQSALISAGAIAGANARYWLGIFFARVGAVGFPWATFTINASGSMVLGLFLGLTALRAAETANWRLVIAVGFCGAFTTFSTFSYELYAMLRTGTLGTALLYGGGSFVGGLIGVALGDTLGRAAH